METSLHGEGEEHAAPVRMADRVRKRVSCELKSTAVAHKWNDAMLRVAREARPDFTPEELTRMVERWRFVAQGMGVAATAVDMVIAAAATGVGINTLAGIWRFKPIDPEVTPALARHFVQGTSPKEQQRENALTQIALGLPLFGAAAGVAVFRPGKIGLSLAAEAAGFAGEKVTRIVRRIVRGDAGKIDRAVYYGVGRPYVSLIDNR